MSKLTKYQSGLLLLLVLCIIFTIALKHFAPVEITNCITGQDSISLSNNIITSVTQDYHYGYINLDSIKTLTKKISGFNNSKRISVNQIRRYATIDCTGYEFEFLGKEGRKTWWQKHCSNFNEAGIRIIEENGKRKLELPYKDGYVLIPYQILFCLTLQE